MPADSREDSFFLRLAGELRLVHLHGQHEAHAVPHILRRQLQAARHQIAELAELAHGIGGAGAQTVHVRAALGGGNQIDVAFGDWMLGLEHPGERPFQAASLDVALAVEGLRRQPLALAELLGEVLVQAAGVEPLVLLAGELIAERDAQVEA